MTSIKPLKLRQMVHLNGIEKYVNSDVRGELVCPKIRIWKNLSKRTVIAVAEPGEEVTLIGIERDSRHVLHYKIEVGTDKGPVRGYVMFPFVDEAVGEEGYGDSDIG